MRRVFLHGVEGRFSDYSAPLRGTLRVTSIVNRFCEGR